MCCTGPLALVIKRMQAGAASCCFFRNFQRGHYAEVVVIAIEKHRQLTVGERGGLLFFECNKKSEEWWVALLIKHEKNIPDVVGLGKQRACIGSNQKYLR